MSDSLCPVYSLLVQCFHKTAQARFWHGQPCTFPLLYFSSPSSIPFFELHHWHPLSRLVRQVQGVWRLGFHGSRAPLLPDSSLGREGKESKGKSLNVPISMTGQAAVAAVGVPGLPRTRPRGELPQQELKDCCPWLGSKQQPAPHTYSLSLTLVLSSIVPTGCENRESP